MKKSIMFLLCLAVVASACSCNIDEISGITDQSTAVEDTTDTAVSTDESTANDETCESTGDDVVEDETDRAVVMAMYSDALSKKVKITDTDLGEIYISEYLINASEVKTAISDIDGDGIDEYIISGASTVVLKYHDGKVYGKSFASNDSYYLNTDGSHPFNYQSWSLSVFGENKLIFSDGKIRTYELWRIVNDGKGYMRYYIEGVSVSTDEMNKYLEENPKTRVDFSPIDDSFFTKLDTDDAINIASEYWNIKSGDIDKDTGLKYAILSQGNTLLGNHLVSLSWVLDNGYSTVDILEIDAYTGKILPSVGK